MKLTYLCLFYFVYYVYECHFGRKYYLIYSVLQGLICHKMKRQECIPVGCITTRNQNMGMCLLLGVCLLECLPTR